MVEPISNTPNPNPREPSANPSRPQASPTLPGAVNQSTNLTPEQRVEVLQEAIAKLIKKSLQPNSILQFEQEKTNGPFSTTTIATTTGEVLRNCTQWTRPDKHDSLLYMHGR